MFGRLVNRLNAIYADLTKGSTLRKYFLLVLVITSLPTLLIAGSSYVIAVRQIERETAHIQELRLERVSEMMEVQLAQLQLMLNQWSYHPVFEAKMESIDFIDDFKFTAELDRTLLTIQMTNPLIEEVSLFLQERSMLFSQTSGPVRLDAVSGEHYRRWLQNPKSIYWEYGPAGEEGEGAARAFMIHKLPVAGVKPYGALIVEVNRKRLLDIVQEGLGMDLSGSAFIIRGEKQRITPAPGEGTGERALQKSLLDAVLKREAAGKQGEIFLLDWGNEKYSVSYGRLTRTDWTYISAAPLSSVTGPIRFMTRNMVGTSAAVLIFALLLSCVASARLYKPIRHLAQLFRLDSQPDLDEVALIEKEWQHLSTKSRELHDRLQEQLPALREGFLMQLVQNHLYYMDEKELRSRMERLGWETHRRGFTVILVQVYGLSKLEGRFSSHDEQLIGFAAANIMLEMGRSRAEQAEIINFQDLSIALLATYSLAEEPQEVLERLRGLAAELSGTLRRLLGTRVTLCIGKLAKDMAMIPGMMEEMKQAIGYRKLEEENPVLELEAAQPGGRTAVDYPFGIERDILQALRLGNREMTLELIAAFLHELERKEGREYSLRQGALQLLGSLLHAILQSDIHPEELFGGDHVYGQLAELREQTDMLQWFDETVVVPYIRKLGGSQADKLQQVSEVVKNWIAAEYMNNISLEELADRMGATPYAVSKAFKAATGMNFIDYLTRHRLEVAKELLENSDLLIQDIAERVGYQTTYLNRIFKKYLDMTPGQYREKSRSGLPD